ncbi:MAG: 50S ribosomal protein L24 [Sandaracinaceae bacterium]|nr:50S ribosomal protein L24 [Sandaracinaceae bacterium]
MGQRIKPDDRVVVIAGRDKGRQGRVLKVFREEERVIVEGINVVRRHTKPSQQHPEGGIIEKELPIHVSNVMPWDDDAQAPTRVRFQRDDEGKKSRVTVKSGKVLD